MPSPFPGMDPFIEGQAWDDFHATFVPLLREQLMPLVRPKYFVEVEQYIYLARGDEESDQLIRPDVALAVETEETHIAQESPQATATLAPAIYTLPVPRQYEQKFLSVRDRLSRKVVTVIEFLSPWNKSPGDGMGEYLVKRSNVLNTLAHLVEIDLLRGGRRLATREPLAPADFYAFLSRWQRPSKVEVYCWGLKDRLPVIPVPLADDDPDVPLDLQAAFVLTYDRAGYDYGLDYRQAVKPRLEPAAAEWIRSVLSEKKLI